MNYRTYDRTYSKNHFSVDWFSNLFKIQIFCSVEILYFRCPVARCGIAMVTPSLPQRGRQLRRGSRPLDPRLFMRFRSTVSPETITYEGCPSSGGASAKCGTTKNGYLFFLRDFYRADFLIFKHSHRITIHGYALAWRGSMRPRAPVAPSLFRLPFFLGFHQSKIFLNF